MNELNMNQASYVVTDTVSSLSSSLQPSSSSLKRSFPSSTTEDGSCTPAKKKTRRFLDHKSITESKVSLPPPTTTTTPGKKNSTLPPTTPKTTAATPTRSAQTTTTKKKKKQRAVTITSPTPRRPVSTVNLLSRRKVTSAPRSAGVSRSCDRFIPNRRHMNIEVCRRRLLSDLEDEENRNSDSQQHEEARRTNRNSNIDSTTIERGYRRQLFSEMCNVPISTLNEHSQPKSMLATSSSSVVVSNKTPSSVITTDPSSLDVLRVDSHRGTHHETRINMCASRSKSILERRKEISDKPKRILDGPALLNDFYLDHMSWSKDNVLAVILHKDVYLWNGTTLNIQYLTTVNERGRYPTSVEWSTTNSRYLVIGTSHGVMELWDTAASKLLRSFQGHRGRIGALAWNQHWLSSGGHDSFIMQHDIRSPASYVSTYRGHEQEVCGLKWNHDGSALASGGNENTVCIWDSKMSSSAHRRLGRLPFVSPRLKLQQHRAAVKALDWCPFRRDVLASGGGTDDRCIKLWNSNSGLLLNSVDTMSQVCGLAWSKDRMELCSAHGLPNNSLMLWEYSSSVCDGIGGGSGGGSAGSSSVSYTKKLTKIKEWKGPISKRVLSMACSPDGDTVVTASADEQICFWDIASTSPKCGRGSRVSGDVDLLGKLTFGMPSIR